MASCSSGAPRAGAEAAEAAENAQRQASELEALSAIPGGEIVVHLRSPERRDPLEVTIRFHKRYPSHLPPGLHVYAFWLSDSAAYGFEVALRKRFVPGEEVVYEWLLALVDLAFTGVAAVSPDDALIEPENEIVLMEYEPFVASESLTSSPLPSMRETLGISSGEPVNDRRSTFQAHVAPAHSREEALAVRDALLTDRKIAKAMHNMLAYRIEDPQTRGAVAALPRIADVIYQDNDDDGECAAGGRLAYLLEMTDAVNVVVVVSRWFGGILLGPDRFKHINNVAREQLELRGFSRRRR